MAKINMFKAVAKAADKKSILPVLTQVFVEHGRAKATNLDIEIIAPVDMAPGAYNVKGELLSNPAPFAEYAPMMTPELSRANVIPLGDIASMIRKVMPAVSTEETRYYLNGIFFEFQAGLKLTATDGHRLFHYSPESVPNDIESFILPREACAAIAAIKGGIWSMQAANGRVSFSDSVSGIIINSKMIDGTFPDYNRVIPRGPFQVTLSGDAAPCLAVFTRCAKYGSNNAKNIKVTGNALEMRPHEVAPLVETWPVDVFVDSEGKLFDIGFNATYVRDILQVAASTDGGKFSMLMSDHASPVRFEFPTIPGLVGVLMPLRV